MPRIPKNQFIDQIVRAAIEPVVARASQAIAAMIAEIAGAELAARLLKIAQSSPKRRGGLRTPRPAKLELTRWVADRRARRVPTFVIEMVGLDTKKKVVAKYGENVAFEKGKPAPQPKVAAGNSSAAPRPPARVVKARPPIVRKAGAAK
jgi:hypothetical protein